jgi:hypothetical protein
MNEEVEKIISRLEYVQHLIEQKRYSEANSKLYSTQEDLRYLKECVCY